MAIAHAAPMPLAAPDIGTTLPFSLPVIDILPDLNFHSGVSLSGQFALPIMSSTKRLNSSALVTWG